MEEASIDVNIIYAHLLHAVSVMYLLVPLMCSNLPSTPDQTADQRPDAL